MAAISVVMLILSPQFIFFAIIRFESTFVEDIKMIFKSLEAIPTEEELELKEKLIEAISLHRNLLGYFVLLL